MSLEPAFLSDYEDVRQHHNRLPHWQQDDCTYFVTFRLADSIPQDQLREWVAERQSWLRWNPPPWSVDQQDEHSRRFVHRTERWLDAGEGSCLLRDPAVAGIVGDAFQHLDGNRCEQHAWVVMPNHVHLLFSLRQGEDLGDLMRGLKGFTARSINKQLGRSGTRWQKDYFDRLIRNAEHFYNCALYIRNNPRKARLRAKEFLLHESALVQRSLGTATSKSPTSGNAEPQSLGDLEVAVPS